MARVIRPITIDFETDAIERRPEYPPKPVGFSIMAPGDRRSRYYAWGHPTANNCTMQAARAVLLDAWKSNHELLFHNAKFDVDVAQTHLGMPKLPWERCHDTLYLLFLTDPHATSLSLKPAAERLLGMAPEERDAVADWLIENKIITKQQRGKAGAHISKAPGDLVGKYADGDVIRTFKLFQLLYPEVLKRDMGDAYDRERKLMPILLENERQGVRADYNTLKRDLKAYESATEVADNWLRKRLKTKDLNLDADADVAEALERCNIITEWVQTPSGKNSVAKKNLTVDKFRDKKVFATLAYRNRLATCMGTFMRPWLRMADHSGGLIYTNWNQVRQSHGNDGFAGARTGRMSSNPNFQNIPKNFYDKDDGYFHPAHIMVPELPLMRKYILPDKGEVFCHRDYNQQELRILGHFEDDTLCAEYNDNPRMDIHTFVQEQIKEIYGLEISRGSTKILNFGMIYGMGLGKLAAGMGVTVDEAKKIKAAQLQAIPGLKRLSKEISQRGRDGLHISTWGGRQYYSEPPKIINGRKQTFEYKLLNYLIQGSAADCTKEAVIRYHDARKREGRFLVTVHDEINLSVPRAAVKSEMKLLREVMQSVEFDVPMLSDGKTGKNWASLVKFKEAA